MRKTTGCSKCKKNNAKKRIRKIRKQLEKAKKAGQNPNIITYL